MVHARQKTPEKNAHNYIFTTLRGYLLLPCLNGSHPKKTPEKNARFCVCFCVCVCVRALCALVVVGVVVGDAIARRTDDECGAFMVQIQDADAAANDGEARTRAQEAKALERVGEALERVRASDESDESDESDGEFTAGPTVWEAAADEEIPENHWEYHMRKNMNDGKGDSVYRNLSYVPVCNCAPVCDGEKCRNPYWMWTKKR